MELIADAWKSTVATGMLVDEYKFELEHTSQQIQHHLEEIQDGEQLSVNACVDVPVVLTGNGGQMEVMEDRLLPDLEDAVILHKSVINMLNEHIVSQAERVLESLRACSTLKQQIHLCSWGISLTELAQKHQQEHIRELQLLHVPRAVQRVLVSGEGASNQDGAQVKMLEKVRDLNKHMHVRSCRMEGGESCTTCSIPEACALMFAPISRLSLCVAAGDVHFWQSEEVRQPH
jgi:hypothetical protein